MPPTPRQHQLSSICWRCPHRVIPSYHTTACFQTVSFKFSYITILPALSSPHPSLSPPTVKSSPGIFLCLQHLSLPSQLNSLHPGIPCETFCSLHVLPQIYIYLLLTVNFNPSRTVFQICMINECLLICASSF